MATLPKWTDERTDTLTNFVGDETPVSQASVAEAAEQLETTTRSVSSKPVSYTHLRAHET